MTCRYCQDDNCASCTGDGCACQAVGHSPCQVRLSEGWHGSSPSRVGVPGLKESEGDTHNTISIKELRLFSAYLIHLSSSTAVGCVRLAYLSVKLTLCKVKCKESLTAKFACG